MNDDVEQVTCPQCGKLIEVVLAFQADEPDTGIRAGWFGGIAIEDTTCFKHMTYAQIEATVHSAIIQREMRDEDESPYVEYIRCPAKIDGGRCFSHWCQDNGCADEGDDDYDAKVRDER